MRQVQLYIIYIYTAIYHLYIIFKIWTQLRRLWWHVIIKATGSPCGSHSV